MLRPTATEVKTLPNYFLILKFDNGETRKFDVKPYIKGTFYGKLQDEMYFKTVVTNGYSVEWRDGQDICPDELYYNSNFCEEKF